MHPDELDVRVTFAVKVNVAEWNQTGRKLTKAEVRSGVRRYLAVLADQELERMGVLWPDEPAELSGWDKAVSGLDPKATERLVKALRETP